MPLCEISVEHPTVSTEYKLSQFSPIWRRVCTLFVSATGYHQDPRFSRFYQTITATYSELEKIGEDHPAVAVALELRHRLLCCDIWLTLQISSIPNLTCRGYRSEIEYYQSPDQYRRSSEKCRIFVSSRTRFALRTYGNVLELSKPGTSGSFDLRSSNISPMTTFAPEMTILQSSGRTQMDFRRF